MWPVLLGRFFCVDCADRHLVIQNSENIYLLFLQNYIKFEEAAGDPARVQILYERAVSKLPLYSELWLKYTDYVDNTLKVSEDLVPNLIISAVLASFFFLWLLLLRGHFCFLAGPFYCQRCVFESCQKLFMGWRSLGPLLAIVGAPRCLREGAEGCRFFAFVILSLEIYKDSIKCLFQDTLC